MRTHNEKLKTLTAISGFHVTGYLKDGIVYYVFGPANNSVKTVCTYRKAKVFAEGVSIGREYGYDDGFLIGAAEHKHRYGGD